MRQLVCERWRRTVARSGGKGPGVFVTGLTAVAIAVIAFFAVQANAAQERVDSGARKPDASASPPARKPEGKEKGTALPAVSGSGQRVVYALKRERVWLVGAKGRVVRTYEVTPGKVNPRPGTYRVTTRSGHITGSDGIPVENVVRFASESGTTIGFSAALKGSPQGAQPSGLKTGGIRESRADGEAMWVFATIGTKVVVVP